MNSPLVSPGRSAGWWSRVRQGAGRASLALVGALVGTSAWGLPIDLRDFFYYEGDPVLVGSTDGNAAGSFAELGEDAALSTVILSNDPGLGDPVLIDPAEGPILRFEFSFSSDSEVDCADTHSCDRLVVTLFDADPVTGGVLGGFLEEFAIEVTSAGVVEFVLSEFGALTFGLQFELQSLGSVDALGSLARVSGLEVYDPNAPPVDPPVSVPEPDSLALLAAGLAGLLLRRRRDALAAPIV